MEVGVFACAPRVESTARQFEHEFWSNEKLMLKLDSGYITSGGGVHEKVEEIFCVQSMVSHFQLVSPDNEVSE